MWKYYGRCNFSIKIHSAAVKKCGHFIQPPVWNSGHRVYLFQSIDSRHLFQWNKLTAEELLFLSKTFPRVANYGIDLRSNEIEGGDYFLDMLESADDLLFWDSRITWLDFYFLFVYRSVVTVLRLRGIARQVLLDFNNLASCQDFDESKINLLCSTRSVSKEHFPRVRFFCYFA